MSFVQDISSSAAVANATTIVKAITGTTAGNLLRVVTGYVNAGLTSLNVTVSDGVNSWTQALHFYDTGNSGFNIAEWYAPNIAGGAATITATFSGATTDQWIYIQERSNIATSSALNVAGAGNSVVPGVSNANAIVLTSITTTGGGTTDVCAFSMDVNGTATVNAGTTLPWTGRTANKWAAQGGSGTMGSEDLSAQPAGAYIGTFGQGGGDRYINFAVAYNNAVAVPLVGQPVPTSGGSASGIATGNVAWRQFTAYASGTATSLNAYVNNIETATTLYLGLYDVNGNLLQSGHVAIATGLNTVSIPNQAIAYQGVYNIAWQADASIVLADDGTNFRTAFTAQTFGSMPATIPVAGGSTGGTGIPSLYALGNLAAGAAGKPLGGPSRVQWHWR